MASSKLSSMRPMHVETDRQEYGHTDCRCTAEVGQRAAEEVEVWQASIQRTTNAAKLKLRETSQILCCFPVGTSKKRKNKAAPSSQGPCPMSAHVRYGVCAVMQAGLRARVSCCSQGTAQPHTLLRMPHRLVRFSSGAITSLGQTTSSGDTEILNFCAEQSQIKYYNRYVYFGSTTNTREAVGHPLSAAQIDNNSTTRSPNQEAALFRLNVHGQEHQRVFDRPTTELRPWEVKLAHGNSAAVLAVQDAHGQGPQLRRCGKKKRQKKARSLYLNSPTRYCIYVRHDGQKDTHKTHTTLWWPQPRPL